jgi:hypothetical protein
MRALYNDTVINMGHLCMFPWVTHLSVHMARLQEGKLALKVRMQTGFPSNGLSPTRLFYSGGRQLFHCKSLFMPLTLKGALYSYFTTQ